MQTFLPYPSFRESAQILDDKRLGKQRVEVLQILRTLSGEIRRLENHPAVKMWKGHEGSLSLYGVMVCHEWLDRGFRDGCLSQIQMVGEDFSLESFTFPSWFGLPSFHASHKSNLKRKDPEYYGIWWPLVPDDLPYVWPEGE